MNICIKKITKIISMVFLSSSFSWSQTVLFQDDFSGLGTSALNGSAPDVTTGGATWTAPTTYTADGNITLNNPSGTAYLPVIIEANNIYTLTVNFGGFSQPSGSALRPVGVGFLTGTDTATFLGEQDAASLFVRYQSATTEAFEVNDSASLVSPNTNLTFLSGTGGFAAAGGPENYTITMTLDTSFDKWRVRYQGTGVPSGTIDSLYEFTVNPTIVGVGVGDRFNTDIKWNSFSLEVTPVPELSTISLLMGLASLSLIAFRKSFRTRI